MEIMKAFLITLMLVASFGCSIGPGKERFEAAEKSEAQGNPRPYQAKKAALAWGDSHADWDKWLTDAVKSKKWPVSLQKPCSKLSVEDCAIQLISIMSKYESSFKPGESFKEGFSDSKGNAVISRGLLQISQESANQSAYGCAIKKAEDLHDPKTNLECAVKILHFQALKQSSLSLIGEPKKGCAAYWSVCRKGSGSYPKIMKYLEQF